MKTLFHSGKFLLLDMASTLFFLAVYLATHNIPLAVALGMGLGLAQIVWQVARKAPIDTMQWMSLFLVLASGTATLLTNNPRFIMIKPSLIYAVVGLVMLKKGWMNRYLPPIVIENAPDVAVVFGYIWSALMFASAGLNIVLALTMSVAAWAGAMSVWAIVSKVGLFLIQYATLRVIVGRRLRNAAPQAA